MDAASRFSRRMFGNLEILRTSKIFSEKAIQLLSKHGVLRVNLGSDKHPSDVIHARLSRYSSGRLELAAAN